MRPSLKRRITSSFSSAPRRPCIRPTAETGENFVRQVLVHLLRRLHGLGLRFLDHRVNHVGLAARVDLPLEGAVDLLDTVGGYVFGDDGLRPGGSSSMIETSRSP